MRVNPAKITGVQSHLILVGRSRLQVEVGGCRFVCSQCWFAVPDRRNQSRSKNSMIAGRAHFDCRSLQLHAAKNALLRALQIQYAINVACDKVSGHDEVIAKIKSNIDEKIQKSVAYVNHANRWVAMIEGTGPRHSQEKLND
ncbi:hypothetical protein [Pseudomonas savastanoi]|uniref:hypothetical protein n=1 Tax=Pseudomonas savastanoi TaxID=29438 RepID=UPI000F3E4090|nr:hypothetical protein [Pseudomonas savastanoi]RMQ63398.1 hypothetical protein ALQ01_200035 [Pseudomonas savastanoi pv. glycinea]